ncbi:MAG: iron uptake transporter permease EfeU [Actinomycetes bacterium]
MVANMVIGLREGLEAALVVGILVAYLVRTGNRAKLPSVWLGVGLAVVLSLTFGAVLTFSSREMAEQTEAIFAGTLSILAVGFVTWMIFWMRRTARHLAGELHGKLDRAVSAGGWAIVLVAFLAVAREGLETSLFIWAAVQSTGSGADPVVGAALGLTGAVVLGYLVYRGALKINLATFFTWTGAALIAIAAGVFAYAIHDLQEGGLLPGADTLAFDLTAQIPPESWYGSLLKGIFNISPAPSVLEVVAWLGYLVPVAYLYFRKPRAVTSPSAAPVRAAAGSTTN